MNESLRWLRERAERERQAGFPETGHRFDRAADEIERLQAIVDRLPKTADSVTVVPTLDQVFGGETDISCRRVYYSLAKHWMTLPIDDCACENDRLFPIPVNECYSTREAAEKSRATC